MRRVILSAVIGCVAGQALTMPSWLLDYPGATARTRTTADLLESSYTVAAGPSEVTTHYRKLFEAAGLPFQPNFDGAGGTAIRGTAAECDLLIAIREQTSGTLVRVSCPAKHPVTVMAPAPVIATTSPGQAGREYTRKVLEEAKAADRKRFLEMEQYDQPVRPPRRPPPPALTWPAWLVRMDGAPLEIRKGVDHVGRKYLEGDFTIGAQTKTLQSFYADLLNSHGYPVWMQSAIGLRDSKAWVDGEYYPYGSPGPRIVIHVGLAPLAGAIQVELRMTASP